MKSINILLAGFGGQGILFAGKVMAYSGLVDGRKVSWLPSYGPEMRGGTANCSVCISEEEIGSPLAVSYTHLCRRKWISLGQRADIRTKEHTM